MSGPFPDLTQVTAAAAATAPWVRRTPVIEVDLDTPTGSVPVVLKLEGLQHAGTFKPRGAFWTVLSQPERPAKLVAASGGNHGLAVAHVGAALGIPAQIFVPRIASVVKVRAIAALGAEVVQVGAHYAEALAASRDAASQPGVLSLHAYDSPTTVAGQGTLGRELAEQVRDLDTVLVAVGGGGLISGVRLALAEDVRVVSVETEGCATYAASRAAGERVGIEPSGVAADALGAAWLGEIAWSVLSANRVPGHEVPALTVADAEVSAARTWLWRRLRLVAEPAGATALAAVLSGKYRPQVGERVAVVVCGANTDPSDLVSKAS